MTISDWVFNYLPIEKRLLFKNAFMVLNLRIPIKILKRLTYLVKIKRYSSQV
jgi:hypothetical protein